jgi:fructose-1-phosphate kinase PfkB-like protein
MQDERQALADLLRFGAQRVLLSCGARGCYYATADSTMFFHSPRVEEISPVGSGDSLVGAFAAKLLEGADEVEAVRWGVAAGSANAAQLKPGFCTPEEIAALLDKVSIEQFS